MPSEVTQLSLQIGIMSILEKVIRQFACLSLIPLSVHYAVNKM